MIYEYNNYKELVRSYLKKTKTSYEKICFEIGIAKPYLSRVLNHHANLNDEQMYKACSFFKFNKEETSYCIDLLLLEKSTSNAYKNFLKEKIAKIQNEKCKISNNISSKQFANIHHLTTELMLPYYTNPKIQILHMLLGIDSLKNEEQLKTISSILAVDNDDLKEMLLVLESLRLIEWKKDSITLLSTQIHLDEEHVLSAYNHQAWRLFCLPEKIKNKNEDYRFTATILGDKKHFLKLKKQIKELIIDCSKDVIKTKGNSVYQLNVDLLDMMKMKEIR